MYVRTTVGAERRQSEWRVCGGARHWTMQHDIVVLFILPVPIYNPVQCEDLSIAHTRNGGISDYGCRIVMPWRYDANGALRE